MSRCPPREGTRPTASSAKRGSHCRPGPRPGEELSVDLVRPLEKIALTFSKPWKKDRIHFQALENSRFVARRATNVTAANSHCPDSVQSLRLPICPAETGTKPSETEANEARSLASSLQRSWAHLFCHLE